MNTSTFEKRIPKLGRVGACLVALAAALVLGAGACNEGGQGDRCNPLRSSNECGGGLVCAGNPIGQSSAHPIPFCPENYCCPANADGTVDYAAASSPYCQPGCNGGAAAICAAGGGQADAEACEIAACLGDASDPSSCVGEGGAPESDASDDASPATDAAPEGSTPEAGPSEAGPSEAGPVEAAAEAASPSEAGPVADSAASD